MKTQYTWDEAKRQANLQKHGLDFADAVEVLASRYRMDIPMVRNGEARVQSFAYVFGCLAVLSVVHLDRDGLTRIVSFRRASQEESEAYYAWIEKEPD